MPLDETSDPALLCEAFTEGDLAALVDARLGDPAPGTGSGDLASGSPWAFCMARTAESDPDGLVGIGVFPSGFVPMVAAGVDEFCDGAAGEAVLIDELPAAQVGCLDGDAYATFAAAQVTDDAALVITTRQAGGGEARPDPDEVTAALTSTLERMRSEADGG
ncbi:hypothetical protein OEB99_17980 [Actinotalea sp. M2MS4P-6]|uniref:hypothetical protein n=1 Tax=Actinotalea sp. M2MS4P-6 TaxID=2983762 RepID=UPI0021E436CF|nr:hypothetical protein [Actinotalea sp. M2MS4P-6]MCV2396203.1 hypothetical protein [Actinotalea sp. M2MS4P-6]